jgi:DNA ligase-1
VKRFAALYTRLDGTTSTLEKVEAIRGYYEDVPAADAAWATWFLIGQRVKRLMPSARLREWATEATGLPAWLVDDAYSAVGDQAETIALLLDAHGVPVPRDGASASRTACPPLNAPLATWVEDFVLPLRTLDDDERAVRVQAAWLRILTEDEADPGTDPPNARTPHGLRRGDALRALFVLHKLLTGALRVGVSRGLVERALAEHTGLPRPVIAHRLMGAREHPNGETTWRRWTAEEDDAADTTPRPYPFFLASPLEAEPESLGTPDDWFAEWKWDGIRAQLIKRAGRVWLWSRGEDLITERFPELVEPAARAFLDGTVLDGEVLAFDHDAGTPLPFAVLQTRIGRKNLTPKVRAQAPVCFMAYDLLEAGGVDIRSVPQHERREHLTALIATLTERSTAPGEGDLAAFRLSTLEPFSAWEHLATRRQESRARRTEGFMLKKRDGVYGTGRQRGSWYKWKIEPLTLDTVLVYAQAGHGRRSNLHTDYTLAVWKDDTLVPIAKAYSGLDDAELRRMDRWIRANTLERFGPVRTVPPEHVFELAFEGIASSSRHKSGLALRFPRIKRWRHDKTPADADTLESAHSLLELVDSGGRVSTRDAGTRASDPEDGGTTS